MFVSCLIKKLDAINNGDKFSLIFYIFYWIVVVIHDILPLKECIVFYSLQKLSAELIFKLKCKFSRLSLLRLIAEGFSFNDISVFHRCRLIISNTVQKQECFTIYYVLLNAITFFLTFRCVSMIGLLTLKVCLWFQTY